MCSGVLNTIEYILTLVIEPVTIAYINNCVEIKFCEILALENITHKSWLVLNLLKYCDFSPSFEISYPLFIVIMAKLYPHSLYIFGLYNGFFPLNLMEYLIVTHSFCKMGLI